MGKERADFLVRGARVYNSYFKKFVPADVYVTGGKFLYIDSRRSGASEAESVIEAERVVDAEGLYMVPGLIDIHMHIESSMLTPEAFCRRLAECGVTTIVSEPHEMANVNGIQGVLDMIRAGENSPVDIFYGIPSCVPSTSPELETTGGIITCEDMERLKENPWVACVGEVMNYRTVIRENQLEITRFLKGLREKDRIFPIEGHCPALMDLDLARFLYLGINGDHTEHSMEELEQRFANGMFMEIQEKMLRREVLDYIREHGLEEHFCFVTDDVMADTFCSQGHLDALVRRAMELGMTAEQAVYNATFTPARRMNLLDRGAIAPGKMADFLLLSDLDRFAVSATYKNGKCIWSKRQDGTGQDIMGQDSMGQDIMGQVSMGQDSRPQHGTARPAAEQHGPDQEQETRFPESYYHSIRLDFQEQSRFAVPMESDSGTVMVRVMEIQDGSTKTRETVMEMPVRDGFLQWEGSGCLLAAVFGRYGRSRSVGYGLVTGDCHKQGAVATSYAHDCHNVLVAGANPADMKAAINRVIEMQGGMAVADRGEIQAELSLNVGGILSDRPAKEVGAGLARVREAMINQGYRHYNPIMSFCTLTLPASPALKLTDKGLIDVKACKIVPLRVEAEGMQQKERNRDNCTRENQEED